MLRVRVAIMLFLFCFAVTPVAEAGLLTRIMKEIPEAWLSKITRQTVKEENHHVLNKAWGRKALPQKIMKMVRKTKPAMGVGSKILQVEARHPGVGSKLVREFGDDGIALGRKLATDDVVKFLKVTPALRRADKLDEFIKIMKKRGGRIFDWLEKHPNLVKGTTLTAGVVYLMNSPELVGQMLEETGAGFLGGVGRIAAENSVIRESLYFFYGLSFLAVVIIITLHHIRKISEKI